MKKLIALDFPRLRHAEFGQLITRLFDDFQSSDLDITIDEDFKRMFNNIQEQILVYKNALDKIRANEGSAKIVEADTVRDADLQALRDALKPYRNAKTQAEKEAYITIKLLLDQYKNVQHTSFEEETDQLDILVGKLLSSEYSFDVSALSIVKFANHLSDSNNAFRNIFAEYSSEALPQQVYSVKALRRFLTQDYKQMAHYILTMANIKNDPFYNEALVILNKGRAFMKIALTGRNGNNTNVQLKIN